VVKLLLQRKADPNAADTFYSAKPLTWASSKGHTAIVVELLAAGATGGENLLRSASARGQLDVVKAILKHAKPTPEQLTAAWAAATNNDVIETLKAAGAKAPEKKTDTADATLQPFVGTYSNKESGELSVVLEKGSLVLSIGSQRINLVRDKDDTFKIEGSQTQIMFERKDNKVVGFALKSGKGEDRKFERVAAAKSKPKDAAIPEAAEPTGTVTRPLNWPQFRGPGATGVADGQYPPTNFDVPKGKNVRWKTPIPGLGHSCPVVWEDHVFITTAISTDPKATLKPGQYGNVDSVKDDTVHRFLVICLDKKSGKIVWEKEVCKGVPQVKRHLKGTHANPTVATDGTHVIACFGAEGLYCYDRAGNFLWKRDLGKLDSGWFYDPDYQWGFGSSPVIFENRVIVQCDAGKNSFIAAYALTDGTTIWQTPRNEIPSWGTPTVVVGSTRTEIVTNATKFARGYDPMTGKELWRLGKHSEITVPTPFLGKGLIWLASGYSPVQPIYAVRPGANGDISLKDKETKRSLDLLRSGIGQAGLFGAARRRRWVHGEPCCRRWPPLLRRRGERRPRGKGRPEVRAIGSQPTR
jgi:outer membrane protein assembly factor BamB